MESFVVEIWVSLLIILNLGLGNFPTLPRKLSLRHDFVTMHVTSGFVEKEKAIRALRAKSH
jgi:hypothetical protein